MDQSELIQATNSAGEYEFLDLSDVDDIERTRLSSALLQKQQQKQQQKQRQQQFDSHEPASLILYDAADIKVNKNPAELSENPQLTYKKISRLNQHSKQQMPKMTPHVNSLEDGAQTSNTQAQQQQQQQLQGQQTTVPHALNSQSNQPSPAPNQSQPSNPPLQQTHPPNTNNIPPHNVQSGPGGVFNPIYQQSQLQHQFVPNFIPHSGHSGNVFQMIPQIPSVYFSNYTNVNVHGAYPHMQQYVQNAYVPNEGHPNSVEQAAHQIQSQPPMHFTRRPGRGRNSRGRGNGSYSRDYHRQLNALSDMGGVQPQHGLDSQALMAHSANFGPYYVHNPYFYSTPAQQATGQPIYGYGYPYPVHLYQTMMPLDYGITDEKSDDGSDNMSNAPSQQWQPIEEYSQQPHDEFNAPQPNEEFVNQPNEYMPTDQQQITNEFIPQQPPNELIPQVQQSQDFAEGFVYSPQQVMEHHSPLMDNAPFKPPNDAAYHPYPNEFVPQSGQEPNHVYAPVPNETVDIVKVVVPDNLTSGNVAAVAAAAVATAVDIKNANLVPNAKYHVPRQHSTDANENAIDVHIEHHNARGTAHGPINGLIQATNEKLALKTERSGGQNKHQQSAPWALKKSTQSVAVSVVPSNNYPIQQTNDNFGDFSQNEKNPMDGSVPINGKPEHELNAAKPNNSQYNNKMNLGSNNNNINNNNNNINIGCTNSTQISNQISNNSNVNSSDNKSKMPIVPKVADKINQEMTTQHSSEVQTVPVSDMQSETHSQSQQSQTQVPVHTQIFSQTNTSETKATTSASTSQQQPAPSNAVQSPASWASLLKPTTNVAASSNRLNAETHRKPVAKVPPYNPSQHGNNQSSAMNIAPNTPGALSYSSAASANKTTTTATSTSTNGSNKRPIPAKARIAPTKSLSSSENAADEASFRLGEFMCKYKVDNNSISLRPRGLTNRSNYCYINAILQALVACPPFYNLMKSIPLDSPSMRLKTNTPTIDAVVELVNEFSHLPNGARLSRRDKGNKKEDVSFELICDPSIEPTAIHKLWNSTRIDNEGRQEDAEEFLGYVLNKLNDEMLELKKLVEKPVEPVPNGMENGDAGDDEGNEWQLIGQRNKGAVTRSTDFGRTPVSDIFRGELRSRLQREGDHSTDVMQPFYTLQLNIEKANSVKEALENFVNKDQLEGVTCTKTNQEVNAWQQMTLEKLPYVLILHLKWFEYRGDDCKKILKSVEFPIELKLDSKILSSKKYTAKQKQYRLFAVVYHDGKEASKGHYITDVYHTGYLNWIRYDDSTIKRVSEKSVLNPLMHRVPYLLYYRRCDTLQQPTNANTSTSTSSAYNK